MMNYYCHFKFIYLIMINFGIYDSSYLFFYFPNLNNYALTLNYPQNSSRINIIAISFLLFFLITLDYKSLISCYHLY